MRFVRPKRLQRTAKLLALTIFYFIFSTALYFIFKLRDVELKYYHALLIVLGIFFTGFLLKKWIK